MNFCCKASAKGVIAVTNRQLVRPLTVMSIFLNGMITSGQKLFCEHLRRAVLLAAQASHIHGHTCRLSLFSIAVFSSTLAHSHWTTLDSTALTLVSLTVAPSDGVAAALWGRGSDGPLNPQELNRSSYVNANPVRSTDSTGHCIDQRGDAAFIADDIDDIATNGYTAEKGAALAADVASAAVPGMSGGGMIVRAALHADDVVDAHKVANKAAATVKTTKQTTKHTPTHSSTKSTSTGGCSFTPNTPVVTPDGAEPIADLEVGDVVLAYNEATGATGVYTVTATWVHLDPVVVRVTLDDETLSTTPEHPFFVLLRGWVNAADLRPGAAGRKVDGAYGRVTRIALEARPQVLYNLTVATAHTFFVGDDGWLVHNDCGGKKGRGKNHLKPAPKATGSHTTLSP